VHQIGAAGYPPGGPAARTGRVITAGATIMIMVFLACLLGSQRVIAEFGVGLATDVFIDAFVLRTGR